MYFDSLMKAILAPSLHIRVAEGGRANAGRGVDRVIGWVDSAPGRDDVELHPGNRAPVELEGRTNGIDFRRRSIHAPEDVELVMVQVHRNRIVGLKRRPLRPHAGRRNHNEQELHDWFFGDP